MIIIKPLIFSRPIIYWFLPFWQFSQGLLLPYNIHLSSLFPSTSVQVVGYTTQIALLFLVVAPPNNLNLGGHFFLFAVARARGA